MSVANGRLSGLRVLVVEDELIIAMELEGLLQGLGCHALGPFPTIRKALDAITAERPEFAVLDVNLRGERVTPVAEALVGQRVPFLLITGYGSERLPEQALQDVPILRKPVSHRHLRAAIVDALDHRAGGPGGS